MFEIEELSRSHPIFDALIEIQKPRSRFQLEKFVLGQHDTSEQQYRQTVLEIQDLIYKIKIVTLELKKQNIEIQQLKDKGDEISLIDAEIKSIEAEQTDLALLGAKREFFDLLTIWESFPHKYTHEEIEQGQVEYWDKRLKRQAVLEAIGGTANQASHLDALRQIGAIEVTETGIRDTSYNSQIENTAESKELE